jgi:hypothetical protein
MNELRPLTETEKSILDCLLNTYNVVLIHDLVSDKFSSYQEKAMALAFAELLVRRLKDGLVVPYTAEEIRATIPTTDRPSLSA